MKLKDEDRMSFFEELKRRNVIRVGTAYAFSSWLLIQVSDTIFPLFGFSDSVARLVVIVFAIGLVPVLIFSWAFELTSEGFRKEKDLDRTRPVDPQAGKKLDRLIMVALAFALGYFAFDKFVLDPARDAARDTAVAQQARSDALVESYGEKSIAVLAFADMSPDKDQEYFSDGISEELLNLLTKVPELRVISRSSAFSFKGRDMDIRAIAEQLQVAHILEGSVRKAGSRIRITAQLIDARSDTHLWSETYDRTLDDVFAIQDEIAAKVVEQLKITLLGAAPTARKTDPEAFALFLQARYFLDQFTASSLEQAAELFQQALGLDSEYPPALKGLAEVYANQAGMGLRPFEAGVAKAWELIEQAVSIDPLYADAYAGLGSMAQYYGGDFVAAAEYFEKAVALGPSQATIVGDAGFFAMLLGRIDQAVELFARQVQLDPVSPTAHSQLARAYVSAGRYDEAESSFEIALNLSPDRIGTHYGLGVALLLNGKPQAAHQEMLQEKFRRIQLIGLAMTHYALGQAEESDAALKELIETFADEVPDKIASILAFRQEIEPAFEWLEKAEADNDPGLSMITINQFFANLRSDVRWQALVERLGMSEQQLARISFDPQIP